MGRQHQGMVRPGVDQVTKGSGEQGKMEKTGCKIICGAPTTLAGKGKMMMIMMSSGQSTTLSEVNAGCCLCHDWLQLCHTPQERGPDLQLCQNQVTNCGLAFSSHMRQIPQNLAGLLLHGMWLWYVAYVYGGPYVQLNLCISHRGHAQTMIQVRRPFLLDQAEVTVLQVQNWPV